MNVQLTIRGRTFHVRTDDDGTQLREMAEDLDQRLQNQAARSRKLDEHSVAIFTALDLLHEQRTEKEQLAERVEALEKELASIIALVESLTSST